MATRVILFHNPTAGLEHYSKEELLSPLKSKGFEIRYVDIKKEDFTDKLHASADLLVVAGGDGTIRKIARHIVGKNIPIGLIPLGTSNNIASGLGISGKPEDIIASWDLSRRKSFNIGVVKKRQEEESFFFESVGFGLMSHLIIQHSKDKDEEANRGKELEKAQRHQQELLKSYQAHSCTIKLDGQQLSGNYLLLEIMNNKFIGPHEDLAPHADPGDGLLNVVLAREDEREKLSAYIGNLIQGESKTVPLNVQQARRLQVVWQGNHYHLDDDVFEKDSPIELAIELSSDRLEFLLV